MKKFFNNKLWRDKMVDIVEQQGSYVEWKYLNDTEYDLRLKEKIVEEAQEIGVVQSRDQLIEELADLTEAINALCLLHKITDEQIKDNQKNKTAKRGGFSGRKFVEIVEHPEGSDAERYCLANPDKYPEIITKRDQSIVV